MAFAPGMQLIEAGLGPADVVSLADPVELPYRNDSEICHALHVTLLLSRSPLDRSPSLYPFPSLSRSTYTLAP